MSHLPYTQQVNESLPVRMEAPKHGGGQLPGEGELMVAEPKVKTKRPPMYYTPMEFVVMVLEHIFRKEHAEAMDLMWAVHKKGAAVVAVYTRDVAETKVDQVMEYARSNDYPLQCTMEQE
jgi:ATP-dependent Clp protease adaptor protein ClpS